MPLADAPQRASVPVPPVGQGWNPNGPLAPLPVAASPGTFISLFPPLRTLRAQPQWSIDSRSGGCGPTKGPNDETRERGRSAGL